jgi:hypothetical protein
MVSIYPFVNQFGGGYYPIEKDHGIYQNPRWLVISKPQYFLGAWAHTPQPQIPFFSMLNLPYLSKLMNDHVHHDPLWPPVPTKLPLDIPKFEGKTREDLGEHVTTFHLWCSSNSLNDDSICLSLFQCTLTWITVKWYIELPEGHTKNFNQMVLVFLNHLHFSVCYNVGIEIFSAFYQDKSLHILDHI